MLKGKKRSNWLPEWVRRLGVAVWISDADRNICYFNKRAETLLGLRADQCIGRPCFDVINGRAHSGLPFCGPMCPMFSSALKGIEVEPYTLRVINAEHQEQWIQVLPIPAKRPGKQRPSLVHCAVSADRTHRMEEFLHHVASRTEFPEGKRQVTGSPLTPREREILELLAEDETLHSIAERLNVSYVTVRNHLQHILRKLGVHSLMEAIAWWLLKERDEVETSVEAARMST